MIDLELYFLFSHSRSIKAKEHLHILGFNIKKIKKDSPFYLGRPIFLVIKFCLFLVRSHTNRYSMFPLSSIGSCLV